MVRNLPAMQEMKREVRVSLLSREDPLEKEMATHSSTGNSLVREIPCAEKPDGLCPWDCKESEMTEHEHERERSW